MSHPPPDERTHYPEAADPTARLMAKLIDAAIAGMLARLAFPFGMVLGLLYLLSADAMGNGQSVGKRLLGLRTVEPSTGLPATVGQSLKRNLDLALLYGLVFIPLLGYVLALVLGVFVLTVEIYAVLREPHGLRMGDLWAQTQVVGRATIRLDQTPEPESP